MKVQELINILEKRNGNAEVVLFRWINSKEVFDKISVSPNDKDKNKLILLKPSS